jgi:hypothetical protein
MSNHENDVISRLVEELDRAVSRDGALIKLELFRKHTKGGIFIANRAGYMRFGIEFLKGGLVPPPEDRTVSWPIQVIYKYLLAGTPMYTIDDFIRDDTLSVENDDESMVNQRVSVVKGMVLVLVIVLLSCVGLLQIIKLILDMIS